LGYCDTLILSRLAAHLLKETHPMFCHAKLALTIATCLSVAAATRGDDRNLFPFVISYDAPDNVTNVAKWLPQPAGQHGFVRAEGGHFVTAGGPIRFWATNLCFDACFPSREQAERLAARLARFGINCVRLHHMDSRSIWGDSPNKLTVDPKQLQRLDYLIYQLARHGIYTNINLHVSRWFGEAEGFAARDERPKYDKGLDNFEPRMIELQKKYARDLLTHVNPHTGNPYTHEPAVACVEINNENALFNQWSRRQLDTLPEPYATTFRKIWNAWLREKYGSTARLQETWDVGAKPLGEELLTNGDFSQPIQGTWNLERDDQTEATTTIASDGPDGAPRLRIEVVKQGRESWRPQMSQSGFAVKRDSPYTLTCYLRSPKKRQMSLNCKMAHEPWQDLGLSTSVEMGPEWKQVRFTFVAMQDDPRARITFTNLTPGIYEIADVSLRPGGIIGLEAGQRIEDDSVPVMKRDQMVLTRAARDDFIDFLWDTEVEYWIGMYRFLKDELGVRPLVSGTQLGYSPPSIQARLDYIDAHSYWQHPRFPGRAWDSSNWYIDNVALVNSPGGTLASLAARRVNGLPFTISEYNHPAPNAYAAEGFPMLAAIAAFQAWDGIYSFAYCHNADFEPRRVGSYFDIKANTVQLAHLPACAALFLRGDVSPAQKTLLAPVTEGSQRDRLYETGDPWQLTATNFGIDPQQSLVHGVAMQLEGEEAGELEGDSSALPEEAKCFVSDTGQIRWDVSRPGAGYFSVDTPQTKLFTGFVRERPIELGNVLIRIGKTRGDWATVSMVCIDGEGFDSRGRILIAATGAMQNRGAVLEDLGDNRVTLGRQWGTDPVLCEGIPAEIVLPVAPERVTLYPLDESGNRRATVDVGQEGGQAKLAIEPGHKTIWYEAVIR
jgi:hypothetical protein